MEDVEREPFGTIVSEINGDVGVTVRKCYDRGFRFTFALLIDPVGVRVDAPFSNEARFDLGVKEITEAERVTTELTDSVSLTSCTLPRPVSVVTTCALESSKVPQRTEQTMSQRERPT